MSRWNPVYRTAVLEPDYRFASEHLLPHFLNVLLAHAMGLERVGTPHAADAVQGLRKMRGLCAPVYDPATEDLFFALDHALYALSPTGAGALRTGLSRNDLDMTVYRLHAREQWLLAVQDLNALRSALLSLATLELDTLILAYTHHQPAQPTTLAHYLSAVENVLSRDTARLDGALTRLNLSPLGAVALAGSSHPLDRVYTSGLLGFDRPVENTYDAVSTGDWQVELAGALSTCATTLSRLLYDLLNWAAQGLITVADGLVQGSSVMPQKRNPVSLEHARTRFSKALGYAQAVVMCNHNVPFGDINDPGTDVQEPLMALWGEFRSGLALLTASLGGLGIDRDGWAAQAQGSDAALTELADALARLPGGDFRSAHAQAQTLMRSLTAQGRDLASATDADLDALGMPVPPGTAAAALDARRFVERRTTLGGPASGTVRTHLTFAAERLKSDQERHLALGVRFSRTRLLETHL